MRPIGLLATVVTLLATPALAQDDLPDLAALIECRADDVAAYNALAFELTGADRDEAMKALGLTEEKSTDSLLARFKLAKPITVFDRPVSHLAFNAAGVFAILDEPDPRALARSLGVEPVIDRGGRFMGEKVIKETTETLEDSGMVMKSRITLNVSTLDSMPGKALAGCGYRMDAE